MGVSAIILAAGAGTRMKSKHSKVVHTILGEPIVSYVVAAAQNALDPQKLVAVVGHGREEVMPLVSDSCEIVIQEEQRGTADAVRSCAETFRGMTGSLVVLSGDCPLITEESIRALVDHQAKTGAVVTALSMTPDNPFGYGRIVRSATGAFERIVEQKDCTPEEAAITECNAGFYCFDIPFLFSALEHVSQENAQGEYYLTDLVEIARAEGKQVEALPVSDSSECLGINTRVQLAQATKVMQARINEAHMLAGVTMVDPAQVWIGPHVSIAQDVTLLPQTALMGNTTIGEDCVVGPNTRLTDTWVGANCTIDETVAIESRIEDDCSCGPRAYLRPGAHLLRGAKAGTHVEIKKSTIGEGSKVPHLSYIGDATLGEGVNIGAGTITCNYDGFKKSPTTVGDRAFVGSSTMLVAPVNVGNDVTIGAGSVITNDVQDGALALGRGRQVEKPGWTERFRASQEKRDA